MDFRKKALPPQPLQIKGTKVNGFRFLGLHINNLSWSGNTQSLSTRHSSSSVPSGHQKKDGLNHQPLTETYRGLVESDLIRGITMWYGNTTLGERKAFQRTIKSAERIIETQLPSMDTLLTHRCRQKLQAILKDTHHPRHSPFRWKKLQTPTKIPLTREYQNKQEALFFSPAAIRLLTKGIQARVKYPLPDQNSLNIATIRLTAPHPHALYNLL